jgi:DtxR family Mn-dependent transcriptional regulator
MFHRYCQEVRARLTRLEEELLEAVWTASEHGSSVSEKVAQESEENVLSVLPELERKGYVAMQEGAGVLTERGTEAARTIVRCHRLAECLMWQGLRTNHDRMEKVGCAFEHVLLPEIVDSICVLLGHPRVCPHGKPIPPGTCCEEAWASVSRVLSAVAELEPGAVATIACLRPESTEQVGRLLALGLVPGTVVTVKQLHPAVILQLGGSQRALDRDVASQVFVWTGGSAAPVTGGRRRRGRRRGWLLWAGKTARET